MTYTKDAGWGLAEVQQFCAANAVDVRVSAACSLRGGYWNDVMALETNRGKLVLKRYRTVMPGTLFPNLPDMEALALERLAGLDVAPDPVGYWPASQVLIYAYVDGPLWQDDVEAVASLLNRKSAAEPHGFRTVAATSAGILEQAQALFAPCTSEEIVAAFLARQPSSRACPPPARLSLIHTDIGAGNLVGRGSELRLIDWQCPAAGDPAEDAFSFLSPAFQILNHCPILTADQRSRFLSTLDDKSLVRRLDILEPAFAFRMAAYCCRRLQTADTTEVRALYRKAAEAELARIGDFA